DFLGLFDGTPHALRSLCEDDLCAVGTEKLGTFDAHCFWHGEDDAIAASRADKCERDSSIAACSLDDRPTRIEGSRALRGIDDRDTDTVFDAPRRVIELKLREDVCLDPVGYPVQANEGSITECL